MNMPPSFEKMSLGKSSNHKTFGLGFLHVECANCTLFGSVYNAVCTPRTRLCQLLFAFAPVFEGFGFVELSLRRLRRSFLKVLPLLPFPITPTELQGEVLHLGPDRDRARQRARGLPPEPAGHIRVRLR